MIPAPFKPHFRVSFRTSGPEGPRREVRKIESEVRVLKEIGAGGRPEAWLDGT
jgi:hypothetical protein